MRHLTLFGRPLGVGLILLQKTLWGTMLLLLAVVLLKFHARHATDPIQELFAGELAEDPHDLLANALIRLVPSVSLKTELLLAIGAMVYAFLEGLEVWGLWREILWVELLIVGETAALLPYDGWELVHAPSIVKILSVAINILIVWYLIVRYLRKRRLHRERQQHIGKSSGEG
jgi:uncharacterized membrane protein (DUF2068 family)